jgi:hypothetical protein
VNTEKYYGVEDYVPMQSFFDLKDIHSSRQKYSDYEGKDRSIDIERMLGSVLWSVLNLENKMLADLPSTETRMDEDDIDYTFRL